MKVLFISHKPPYPIVDGGCHAMDRMLRDFLFTYPEASITYLSLATEKHPFDKNSIPSDLVGSIDFMSTQISTRINAIAALIHLFNKQSYNISRFFSSDFNDIIIKTLKSESFDIVLLESLFNLFCLLAK